MLHIRNCLVSVLLVFLTGTSSFSAFPADETREQVEKQTSKAADLTDDYVRTLGKINSQIGSLVVIKSDDNLPLIMTKITEFDKKLANISQKYKEIETPFEKLSREIEITRLEKDQSLANKSLDSISKNIRLVAGKLGKVEDAIFSLQNVQDVDLPALRKIRNTLESDLNDLRSDYRKFQNEYNRSNFQNNRRWVVDFLEKTEQFKKIKEGGIISSDLSDEGKVSQPGIEKVREALQERYKNLEKLLEPNKGQNPGASRTGKSRSDNSRERSH